jgi:predicted ATP-dependent protease
VKTARELKPQELYRSCDFGELEFETTDDLEDLTGLLGQPRAVEAVEFGIEVHREGYNIFAFGPDGTGKYSAVQQMLEERAAARPTPPDLCYVHNFKEAAKPRLLELPPGKGCDLCEAMQHLVEEVASALQAAVESDEYHARRRRLEERLEERQGRELSQLEKEASAAGLALLQTPMGIVFAPRDGDEVLSAEKLQEMPEKARAELEVHVERLKKKLQELLRQFSRWKRRKRDQVRELNREVARFAIGPLLEDIREHFAGLDSVTEYLKAVESDIVDNAERLSSQTEQSPQQVLQQALGQQTSESHYRHYRVNLLVDCSGSEGAPVVYEDNPTFLNLVGRVEHVSSMGTMVTDFTLIKPGALHQANGGYLLLDALKLIQHPYAWEGLKRTLRAGRIKIEPLAEALSLISTHSLQPEPAKLDVKIVLLGSPRIYYLLSRLDPDFAELFKVAADFAEELDWNSENREDYARLVAKLAREKELMPFSRDAVARLIEQGARDLGDGRKMSLYMGRVLDLMREADHWAIKEQRDRITAKDIQKAVDARIFRSDRLRDRVQEQIQRGTLLIDTAGAKIGQINGLSVYQLNDFSFGRPSRITARVRLGKGEMVDIEREVELAGPLHSKGVLILAGYLGARFAAEHPLALSASLVMEQSYGGVDGDSASSAELYALLSAISELPLRQSLAVTGSVNQLGEVQAIGGVNMKIEGFFDLCAARGLSGEQGVLIPISNVDHLMLRADIVAAVEAGKFHIYPVTEIDQGIELLTGVEAGEADADGVYPEGSVNGLVAARLAELARKTREFSTPPGKADASA